MKKRVKHLVDLLDASDILYAPMPILSEEEFHGFVEESKRRTLAILDQFVDLE